LVKLCLAATLAAALAPAVQAAPVFVTEFQGNTSQNAINVFSFAPGALTFQITPASPTTSMDPRVLAGINATLGETTPGGPTLPFTPFVHGGNPGGQFTLSFTLGSAFTDGAGNNHQLITITGTSSDDGTNPLAYIPLNIQDGFGGSNYAQLALTGVSADVVDNANGSHAFNLQTDALYIGQTGPSTTYDFTPFLAGGSGHYGLGATSAAPSLIDFVVAAAAGADGMYPLLSNDFEEAVTAVPEPMSLTLLCTAVPFGAYVIRRKRIAA